MAFSFRQKRKLKISVTIIIVGNLLGLFYVLWSDGFGSLFPYINTIVIATLLSVIICLLELQVIGEKIRKFKFIPLLLLRTSVYVILIPLVIFLELITARVIKYNQSYKEIYYSEEFQNYLINEDFSILIAYAIVLSLFINFIYQINRKMGQGILLNFITGKYKKPDKSERIFMFMHVSNSEEIINKIGSIRFLEFLNKLFFDITETVLLHHGKIYEYVEDECVISWRLNKGVKNANCLITALDILQILKKEKMSYISQFEVYPQLEMALHCGPVLQAELGMIKSKVAFYGDVMNITSRILDQCNLLKKQILISSELKNIITVPKFCKTKRQGEFNLKGMSKPIELFSLSTINNI